jgi:flagellar biogenesis protein FliO
MDILYITISMLGVLGLMFLTFFGLRMFNRRISTSGGRLRVIDRATLGRDSMLLVVSVCGKLILVGVSPQRVEKLADLDVTEEEYVETAFSSANKGVLPFSDILSSFMRKKDFTTKIGDDKNSQDNESNNQEE